MFNRDAYINEVKEEDRKFYRQVYDLEKRQAAASIQEVKPKKEIDIVQEAKAEDLINLFKNDLETQIQRVEQLLTKTYTDGGASSTFNEILNDYTKTLGRYNAIVSRLTGRLMIDQKTKDAIKTKFLDVKPQIDALFFSIDELIGKIANDMDLFVDNIVGRRITTPENVWPYLFGKLTNITGKKSDGFPIFVSWLSIYRSIVDIIRNQINSNSYRPIDNNEIRISINKFQSNLPKPDEEGFYFLDPIGKFSTLLSFYLNTRSGARFGDLKLEEKINKRVEELRGELGRDLTDDEIKEVRARLGAGGERLFIDPRLPTETRERVEYLQPAGTRGAKLTALYEPNYGGDDTGYQMGNFPDMEFPITDDFLNYDVAANIPPGQTLQRFKQLRRDRLRVKLLNYLSYFKPERFRKVEIEGIQEDRPTPNFDDINEKILEMNMRLGPLVQDNLDELGDLGNAVLQTTQLIDRLRDNPRITTQQIRDYYRLMERLTSLIFGIGSAYIESFYNLEEEPEAGIIEQEEAIEEGQEEEEEDEEEEFMPPDFMPAAEFEVEGFGKRRRKKIIKERMKKGRRGQILYNDSKNDPFKNYN